MVAEEPITPVPLLTQYDTATAEQPIGVSSPEMGLGAMVRRLNCARSRTEPRTPIVSTSLWFHRLVQQTKDGRTAEHGKAAGTNDSDWIDEPEAAVGPCTLQAGSAGNSDTVPCPATQRLRFRKQNHPASGCCHPAQPMLMPRAESGTGQGTAPQRALATI